MMVLYVTDMTESAENGEEVKDMEVVEENMEEEDKEDMINILLTMNVIGDWSDRLLTDRRRKIAITSPDHQLSFDVILEKNLFDSAVYDFTLLYFLSGCL